MKYTLDYKKHLLNELKDPEMAIGYLNECLNDDDDGVFLLALRDVVEAQGGIRQISQKSKLNREHLFRMLSKKGNPRLESIKQLADAFGWRLAFVEKSKSKRAA